MRNKSYSLNSRKRRSALKNSSHSFSFYLSPQFFNHRFYFYCFVSFLSKNLQFNSQTCPFQVLGSKIFMGLPDLIHEVSRLRVWNSLIWINPTRPDLFARSTLELVGQLKAEIYSLFPKFSIWRPHKQCQIQSICSIAEGQPQMQIHVRA